MKLLQLRYGPGRLAQRSGWVATAAFVVGGVLVVWSSYIHFHLWQGLGYRHIPTIGPLFVLQSISGLVLGLLIVASRRVWAGVLGIGFGLSTLAGFLVSTNYGLFGFKDTWAAPFAHESFNLEIATIVILAIAVVLCLTGSSSVPDSATNTTGSTAV